jgi:hypothetical protein
VDSTGELSKVELIALLSVPEHLTVIKDDGKVTGIRSYYAKYKACLEAQETLREMCGAGTWPGKRPTNISVIQLFVSKTNWFSYLVPAFSDINNFPVIKGWLEGEDGCVTDLELWGKEKATYTFADLQQEKERRRDDRGDDRRSPDKGKKKKKVKNDKGEGTSSTKKSKRKAK